MNVGTDARRPDVRVAVVDDSPLFCAVSQEVVQATEGFVVVAVMGSGEQAARELERVEVDLVLIDVRLADMDGPAVARSLGHLPSPPVVVLLSADEWPDIAA